MNQYTQSKINAVKWQMFWSKYGKKITVAIMFLVAGIILLFFQPVAHTSYLTH